MRNIQYFYLHLYYEDISFSYSALSEFELERNENQGVVLIFDGFSFWSISSARGWKKRDELRFAETTRIQVERDRQVQPVVVAITQYKAETVLGKLPH